MQKSVTELKSLTNKIQGKYNKKQIKYLYSDDKLNEKGVNYNRFLKIKNYTINNNLINSEYEINGWYILWCLMSYSINSEYIETTIGILIKKCNLNQSSIKRTLIELDKKQIISLTCDVDKEKITKYTILSIAIPYNNYIDGSHGYRPLPVDISRILIGTLSPVQWAIYTLLISKYSYFMFNNNIEKSTGSTIYGYRENNYSYPTEEQIEESLGVSRKTVRKQLKELEAMKLIKIVKYDEFKNKRYEVILMQKIEYVYHYIYKLGDNREKSDIEIIAKKGFEEIAKSQKQKILNDKDYVNYKFKKTLNQYDIQYKTLEANEYLI